MEPNEGKLELAPSNATSASALIAQEYFYSMALDDPDPSAYSSHAAFDLDGPLDVDALEHSMGVLIDAHDIFRTRIIADGEGLRQHVQASEAAPRSWIERLDKRGLPPEEWETETRRTVDELAARGLDLGRGIVLWARVTQLADDRHLLVVVFHHGAVDGGSSNAFFRKLFALYASTRAGEAPSERPALQYIDVAAAFDTWATTPNGQASAAYWRQRLADAPAVEVPADLARAPIDARREAVRRGITADRMYAPEWFTLEHDVREGITRLARIHRISIYGAYLAGLVWLLHQETGQTDICVESSFDLRSMYPALDGMLGPLTAWTILRVDLAGATTFEDALARSGRAVAEVKERGVIYDYYRHVPHTLRRVILNYVPQRWRPQPAKEYAGVKIDRLPLPFAPWKRPWDLHLTVLDGEQARLAWTGNEKLFHHETVVALFLKLRAILAAGAASAARALTSR